VQTDIDPRDLIGHKAVDRNGDKIGTVDEVYLDDATGAPEWAAVRTGVFGRDAFVPLMTSEFAGDLLRVPYEKSLVKDSPDFGVGQHLSPAQELQLYRYYGLRAPEADAPAPGAGPDRDLGIQNGAGVGTCAESGGFDTSGFGTGGFGTGGFDTGNGGFPSSAPAQDLRNRENGAFAAQHFADTSAGSGGIRPERPAGGTAVSQGSSAAVSGHTAPPLDAGFDTGGFDTGFDTGFGPRFDGDTGSSRGSSPHTASAARPASLDVVCREERLEISTEWHVLGTARLRKYVITEKVEHRVPVVRERFRVERVPVSEAELATLSERDIAEAVEEVTLREQRSVVHKRLVPVERVRLVVERIPHEEVIHEELRREQIKVHDTIGMPPGHSDPESRSLDRLVEFEPAREVPSGIRQVN
jgi:stress response protein YsnF/sporulation protein YlmC with PRC-barrel domain